MDVFEKKLAGMLKVDTYMTLVKTPNLVWLLLKTINICSF
jgi:hypothetical protein